MSKTFHITTFGCRTNQADSAALAEGFLDREFEQTEDWTHADVLVVNSCTVTQRSDQQVRQLIRRLRRGNPAARLVVTGCYAQRDGGSLASIPGVDAVVGNTLKHRLVELSEVARPQPVGEEGASGGCSPPDLRELAAVYVDDFRKVRAIDLEKATQAGGRTRPFLKIQDGCDACCSYCIIPAVRGPSRSVPPQQIIQQARDLVRLGFKEIVLTGIHIGTYGMYLQPRFPLDRLLAELIEIEGLCRLRVSSIEPMQLSHRVIALAARSGGRIAPHFHICLQSGSDRVLKRMLRPYNTTRFAGIVEEIHQKMPWAGIGTDIIAGFPGESEQDHEESYNFVKSLPFSYLHVFPYSDRSGTSASVMADKVRTRVIRRRAGEFRKLSEQKNKAFRRGFLGSRLSVLTLSEEKDGIRSAISNNYLKARVDPSISENQILDLAVVGEEGDCLTLQ